MDPMQGSDRRCLISVESLKESIQENLRYIVARPTEFLSRNDWYLALAHAVRDRIVASWIDAGKSVIEPGTRIVSYLSAEFLVGPHLANNLLNLGMMEEARGPSPTSARTSIGSFHRKRSLDWETAGSGAWPLATSIPWPLSECSRSATAFAMSLEFSTRRSSMAGRWRSPTSGFGSGIPGRSPA